jgi:hypothetical protein
MTRKLLFSITKDQLEWQTFTAGGPGGQHQNKVETAARVIHRPSGAMGESRSEKSQIRNKRLALRHLAASPKFKVWVYSLCREIETGLTLDERVDALMATANIRMEIKDEQGRWVEVPQEAQNG